MELRRISPGLHTIKVAVASPGWSSDTRTINVLDVDPVTNKRRDTRLSFTLLPTSSTATQGPPGPAGANGGIGAPGASGAKGDTGAAGPTGPKGDTGATGAIGATGATGAIGATGSAGATGPAGAPGAPGAVGAAGPQGPTGPQGLAGANGSNGAVSVYQTPTPAFQQTFQVYALTVVASLAPLPPGSWSVFAKAQASGAINAYCYLMPHSDTPGALSGDTSVALDETGVTILDGPAALVLTGVLDTSGTNNGADLLCTGTGGAAVFSQAKIVAQQASQLHTVGPAGP